jgi:hypothetical protein
MAPRSELALDLNCFIEFEFKPRAGTWASYDAWSQPKSLTSSTEEQSQDQPRRRRRVRFASRQSNEIQEYMHVTEYTPEEKDACFYRRPDYQAMRTHNAETLEKMTYRVALDESSECHFGLETRTPLENIRCHQLMRNAILAVLDEQDDQWRFDGCLHPEIIAARYSSHTWESQDRARCLGRSQSLS